MLSTIGDVKTVARKVWPSAVEFNVQLVTATGASTEGYRVTAFGDRRRILGRLMAPTLNKLKAELEQQLESRKLSARRFIGRHASGSKCADFQTGGRQSE